MGELVPFQIGVQQGAGARWVRRVIGVGAVAVVCLTGLPGVASAAPVSPSDSQLTAAQQAKDAAAQRVTAITDQLAQAQAGADVAYQQSQIALQDYEDTQAAYESARTAADAAAAAAAKAAADVEVGRAAVVSFARASYMQGSTDPGMTALLTAGGPAQLIERAALLQAAGTHHTDVVAELSVLQDQATAADAVAKQTVTQAATVQAQAADSLAVAQTKEVAARTEAAALVTQQDQVQGELAAAQQTLYGVENARKAAEAYAEQQAAATAAARAAAKAAVVPTATTGSKSSASPSSGSPSSGSSSAGSSSGSSSGSSTGSTATKSTTSSSAGSSSGTTTAGAPSRSAAQIAIDAAMAQRGMPYSWGGGGSRGPSYGIPPDTDVYGFDCSGLTEYAYAQAGIAIGGISRDQYYKYRNKTVARSDLQPGDLVFWASGSSYTSIYHVALYIGNNKVVAAPQSGDVVKVSTVWSADYFGAVRPTG